MIIFAFLIVVIIIVVVVVVVAISGRPEAHEGELGPT